jgi:hypothetical protein
MDCRTARLLLDFHRPRAGELPPEEAGELERHLAGCADCDAAGRTARRLDDHLGAAIRAVPLPDGLHQRLLARLKEERGTRLHRRLAWGARGLAVAAALLLGTLLWLRFRAPEPPPKLDLERLTEAELFQNHSVSPERVQFWFQENHHVTMVPPPAFAYDYLVDYEMTDLQGKRVPKLVFRRDQENASTRASVYVVAREQFDLPALDAANAAEFEKSGQRLDIWGPRAERPDTAYVIVFDGDLNQVLGDDRPR